MIISGAIVFSNAAEGQTLETSRARVNTYLVRC